ncbi:hypothetical protein MIMGU_mgv1a017653mg, partial [Erythranthe guttata]
MAKYFLVFFILYACYFREGKSCFPIPRVHVYISNEFSQSSDSLLVHCKSDDDDLGTHSLTVHQDFHFDFCVKPFRTLFYCYLTCGKRTASFDVYNAKWTSIPCQSHKNCAYVANEN